MMRVSLFGLVSQCLWQTMHVVSHLEQVCDPSTYKYFKDNTNQMAHLEIIKFRNISEREKDN